MIKPKWMTLRKSFIFVTIGCLVFIPSLSSVAEDQPNPSPTAVPVVIVAPPPGETTNYQAFNPNLYSIDQASSPWVVVNKRRPLNPIDYQPANLVRPRFTDGAGVNPNRLQLAKPAAVAMKAMATAMHTAGAGILYLSSTYRSYANQTYVHNREVSRFGLAAGEHLAARPGFSEHQTGLAADVGAVGQGCLVRVCFARTKAGLWLAANAWQFGFILRYPDGATPTTGYQFEPWHFRYVGTELSTEMHNSGVKVLENFWKLPAAPSYAK